jgi:hypothetical protein
MVKPCEHAHDRLVSGATTGLIVTGALCSHADELRDSFNLRAQIPQLAVPAFSFALRSLTSHERMATLALLFARIASLLSRVAV